MVSIQDGQCGMCAHFGGESEKPQIIEFRIKGEAPETLVESCGHPAHADLQLKVSVVSTCEGFTPAEAA